MNTNTSKNLLITGSQGQLGRELKNQLGEAPNIHYTDREELDITDEKAVKAYIAQHPIDIVINCAAYTAVDKAEDEPELANTINHIGAEILAKHIPTIIHISTDYIFDGTNNRPYQPQDIPNPISVYGQTKLAGEKAIFAHAKTALIIRTAWVYSNYGHNFVKTILRLSQTKNTLNIVSDQIGSPTYAKDLAQAILQILPQIQPNTKIIGHYTNEGVCSWYDLAKAIIEETQQTCQINPIMTTEYPTKAKRPAYSVLDKTTLKNQYHLTIRHWRDALRDCLKTYQQS